MLVAHHVVDGRGSRPRRSSPTRPTPPGGGRERPWHWGQRSAGAAAASERGEGDLKPSVVVVALSEMKRSRPRADSLVRHVPGLRSHASRVSASAAAGYVRRHRTVVPHVMYQRNRCTLYRYCAVCLDGAVTV